MIWIRIGDPRMMSPSGLLHNSAPSTTYRLEFFSNPACDASGNGESRTFLGSADVTTDAIGDVSFSVPLSAGVGSGEAVTATATDPGGSTSELSGCVEAIETVSSFNWHYEYDALYRLTYACSDWDNVATACKSNEAFFRYTYDGVGNRLTQETLSGTNSYMYDAANRLTSVDGVSYSWDAKGNLLSDGTWSYTYNHANRLVSGDDGVDSYDFSYNGRGDRLLQTVNGVATGYTLDINRGLTQVLADGSNTYLYGDSRIGEEQSGGWQYHLGDALGSVRQLTDGTAAVTAARAYEPFGSTLTSTGSPATNYAFTGEWADRTGLIHLRARYLEPEQGRFVSKDPWGGEPRRPLTQNDWAYALSDPINLTDPSGLIVREEADDAEEILDHLLRTYNVRIHKDWGYGPVVVTRNLDAEDVAVTVSCTWEEGNWRSIRELQLTKVAIQDTAGEFGSASNFRGAVARRPIDVVRWSNLGRYHGIAPHPFLSWALGEVILADSTFDQVPLEAKFTVAHEIGHVWDFREVFRLSREMALEVGTLGCIGPRCRWDPTRGDEPPPSAYARTNELEDWAESFGLYVYTEVVKNPGLGSQRRDFIQNELEQIRSR